MLHSFMDTGPSEQLHGSSKRKKEQIMQRNRQLYRSNPNMISECTSIFITNQCWARTISVSVYNMLNVQVIRTITALSADFDPEVGDEPIDSPLRQNKMAAAVSSINLCADVRFFF